MKQWASSHPWPPGVLVKNICDELRARDRAAYVTNAIGMIINYNKKLGEIMHQYMVLSGGKVTPWAFDERNEESNILK